MTPACENASVAVNISNDKDLFIVTFSLFYNQSMPGISDTVTIYFCVPL